MGCCFTTICRESSTSEIETFPKGYTDINYYTKEKVEAFTLVLTKTDVYASKLSPYHHQPGAMRSDS